MNPNVALEYLSIGYTWFSPRTRRTGCNRECKLLMLTHAFETLEALRVEFIGDARNSMSRNALTGIGASFEGVKRANRRYMDGENCRYLLLQHPAK